MSANATASPGHGPIRGRRIAAGLTQEQLARTAECSLAYVRVLEHGYLPEWDASPTLRRVAELLGLGAKDLMVNDDDPAATPGRVEARPDGGEREPG